MAKILGSIKVRLDGKLYKTVPDSGELSVGGEERTAVIADGTFNWQGKPVPANFKCKFLHVNKTALKTLNEFTEGVLEIETDIDVTYTIDEATRMGAPISSSSSDGQITAEFSGMMTLKK